MQYFSRRSFLSVSISGTLLALAAELTEDLVSRVANREDDDQIQAGAARCPRLLGQRGRNWIVELDGRRITVPHEPGMKPVVMVEGRWSEVYVLDKSGVAWFDDGSPHEAGRTWILDHDSALVM